MKKNLYLCNRNCVLCIGAYTYTKKYKKYNKYHEFNIH